MSKLRCVENEQNAVSRRREPAGYKTLANNLQKNLPRKMRGRCTIFLMRKTDLSSMDSRYPGESGGRDSSGRRILWGFSSENSRGTIHDRGATLGKCRRDRGCGTPGALPSLPRVEEVRGFAERNRG